MADDGSTVPLIRTRHEAEAFLDARIGHGVQPGLERITGLLEFMGNPQESFAKIHVAGTNGKTTVSRMTQQILGAHGLATGGFTSPHLHAVEERFTLHGVDLSPTDFTDAVAGMAWFVVGYEESAATPVTYFEVTAALAMSILADAAVDVGVIEVGLGGRLDATNVITADVSVITGIAIDHTEFLGSTIGEIAGEKAAILKSGGSLVSGVLSDDALAVVGARVAETGSKWTHAGRDFSVTDAVAAVGGWQCTIEGVFAEYPELYLPVHGRHQVDHLATAVATAEMFLGRELDPDALALAAGSTSSPGRLEVVARRPVVLLDGAHNVEGIGGLAATLDGEFSPMEWHVVLGVRGERSIQELVRPLKGRVAAVIGTAADDPSSIAAQDVAQAAGSALGVPHSALDTVTEAVHAAIEAAGPEGGVAVTGSLYVVGEARAAFETRSDATSEAHIRFEAERPWDDEEDDFHDEQEQDPSFG